MNPRVGPAEIGQWYLNRDKGEMFRVTGYDDGSRTIEIQTSGGDVDEIDADGWYAMPLELAAEPEDSSGPPEAWQDATPAEERESAGKGSRVGQLLAESEASPGESSEGEASIP